MNEHFYQDLLINLTLVTEISSRIDCDLKNINKQQQINDIDNIASFNIL